MMQLIAHAGLAALLGAALAAPAANAAVMVPYSPVQSGVVNTPVLGLGVTASQYLLVHDNGTSGLSKAFSGNYQETGLFANPSTAKDAASLDNQYMLHLGAYDNNIRTVTLSDGSLHVPSGIIYAGPNSFGIGYDAGSHSIGIGQFSGGQMTFKTYSLHTHSFSSPVSFAFDPHYGTPTGLDYVVIGNAQRMLVSTKDAPGGLLGPQNYVLDMSATTGVIDQYVKTAGSTNKLEDTLYTDGKLVTAYDVASLGGRVQVAPFTPIPEPAAVGLAVAAAAACLLARRRAM